MAAVGLPSQEICWSCLQLSATGAFRAVMQPPPSPSLWRDIHTPPAPYAAWALTQGVRTGRCHLLCHIPGHKAWERQGEARIKQNPRWDRRTGKIQSPSKELGSLRELKAGNQPLVPGPGGALAHTVHWDGPGSSPLMPWRAMGKVAPTQFCHRTTCNAQKTHPAD